MDIPTEFASPVTKLAPTPVENRARTSNAPAQTQGGPIPSAQAANLNDTFTLNQPDDTDSQSTDPIERFLALGRQQQNNEAQAETDNRPLKTLGDIQAEQEQSFVDNTLAIDNSAEIESVDKITEKSRDFDLPNTTGDPAAILKKSEEIQRQAQALGNSLTAEEQVAVDKARRLGIQARFELEKAAREEARTEREEALEDKRAEAAAQRRANAPSPFIGITTPFDIVEEIEPVVNLGTSINLTA